MSRVAIIPARGGSRRIPRKNIRLFHGRPIISYAINTAKAAELFDYVMVSTEDEEIAQIAKNCGADVLMRPCKLARDEVGTQEVVGNALKQMGVKTPSDTLCCCIYATSPLLLPNDLRIGYALLWARPAQYCVAVCTDPLADAGAFYWGTADNFINNVPLYTEHTAIYPLPIQRVCDINEERDWIRAERLYEEPKALHAART